MGSLFDGIAGFPLAAIRAGITPVWASEIEPFPIAVSKAHFPGMKHLGSVTDINGAEIEPVDIITFGSPCQDLSVAGKRAGLEGARSGLFGEAVRIIREMQRATANEYPRYAVWENVPGAFSSNEGKDFACVVGSLVGAELSVPEGGWTSAGVAFGPAGQVAWRILDAQYWGVPQRRRRIFLVYDPRGERAGEILFVDQGVSGHLAESREAREGTAGGAGDGVDVAGFRMTSFGEYRDDDSASTVKARDYKDATDLVVQPQLYDMTHAEEVMRPVTPGLSPTLNARMGTGENQIPVLIQPTYGIFDETTPKIGVDVMPTLRARERGGGFQQAVAYPDPSNTVSAVDCRNLCETEDKSGTLQCKQTGGYSLNYQNPIRIGYAVRRLTPTECLRLQGFPDNWFDGIKGSSDTACYKATGNSIAVPCVEWIMGRIADIERG
jgi:DNA (cytosine-5)-methyltransferase 1